LRRRIVAFNNDHQYISRRVAHRFASARDGSRRSPPADARSSTRDPHRTPPRASTITVEGGRFERRAGVRVARARRVTRDFARAATPAASTSLEK
jgi:hypothetical protein